jgi:RNA polymerase-binding transcription factor DksA
VSAVTIFGYSFVAIFGHSLTTIINHIFSHLRLISTAIYQIEPNVRFCCVSHSIIA